MDKIKILWADDEIAMLRPQLIFLQQKGYDVTTVTNGHDALDEFENNNFDVVFLDESMPGLTGLETLERIKSIDSNIPVVMITKNAEEGVMEEAIGSQIADYLLKPVNPNQILLSLKKIIDNRRLVREKTSSDYQQEFRQISMDMGMVNDTEGWVEIYKRIINWELRLDAAKTDEMADIVSMQKQNANTDFSKFIVKNYQYWFEDERNGPIMSHNLMRNKVLPVLKPGELPTVMLLLDNLRYDQWKMIEPLLTEFFRVEEESYFFSMLPTATQYSRNAIFAGLLPSEIDKKFPDWWLNDNEEGGKNLHEKDLLGEQIKRLVRKPITWNYTKITNVNDAKHLQDNIKNYIKNDLTVIVYNFIDMLSHARTEMEVLKELAGDETAYRSLTRSWFEHSLLWDALKKVVDKPFQLIVTTDHGTIRVKQPSKVVGDRETTTNLRYKVGKNLQYDKGDVLEIRNPEKVGLPRPNVSSSYIFAKEDIFFLYPNNYNHFNNYYRNTFQHGGISLEEMIVPVVKLRTRV